MKCKKRVQNISSGTGNQHYCGSLTLIFGFLTSVDNFLRALIFGKKKKSDFSNVRSKKFVLVTITPQAKLTRFGGERAKYLPHPHKSL